MPHIVDPRPWLEAELTAKRAELERAELDTSSGEDSRARLKAEIADLERQLHRGWLRGLLGWRRRSAPW